MDSFAERLRALTKNKYFAYIAVIFFAFLTALIFAVFALQPTIAPTSEDIRTSVGQAQQNSTDSSDSPSSSPEPAQKTSSSPLGRIISIITGKAVSQDTTTQDGQTEGTGNPTGSGENPSGDAGGQQENPADAIDRVLQGSTKMPEITIDKYVLVTDLPEKPTDMKAYRLKTSFTDTDAFDLADNLGFDSVDAVEKGTNLSQLYDLNDSHYLGFDTQTGGFTYLSETGLQPIRLGTTVSQTAKNILGQIGIDHPSIKPYATYKRSDDAGYTYVELHADWSAIGGPIVNPVGFLNLTDTDRVDTLSIGSRIDNSHPDAQIIQTSDDTDGYARADGFNTITVKISDSNNRVYAISSNIPQILASETLATADLKSPIQAFDEYTKGQTSLALTGPSGEGTVNLADVYTGNISASESVDVIDFDIIYAASLTGHTDWWCPSYAFRSYGQVQTGFEVQYGHLVPASRDPRCQTAVLGSSTQIAQTNTGSDTNVISPTPDASKVVPTAIVGGPNKNASSLQYGSLGFKVRAVVDVPTNECPTNSFNHSYTLDETGDYIDYIAWIDKNKGGPRSVKIGPNTTQASFKARTWYFVRKKKAGSSATLESLSTHFSKSELHSFRARAYRASKIGDPTKSPLDQRFDGLETVTCQFIVTASPWIYAYNDTPTDLTVSLDPVGGVSYVNPSFTNTERYSWDVTTQNDGTLNIAHSRNKQALFWEYNKYSVLRAYHMHARKPEHGFVVATSELENFMGGLSPRIGLNTIEQKNVLAELRRAGNQFDSPFVKVSFVSDDFVDTYLPLTVSPTPDTMHRVYFELTPLRSYTQIDQPNIPQITREGLTVIETGFIVLN